MKTRYGKYTLLAFLTTTIGCGVGNGTTVQEEEAKRDTATVSDIVAMPPYSYGDTVHAGCHLMVYKLERHSSDSVFVRDPETGDKYADNYYDLIITRDGHPFFAHRFTKASFASFLDKGFRKNGILDGFRFSEAKEGVLRFGACISYPDSDMSTPFVVAIGQDGNYGIKRDDVMDVVEDNDDMENE